MIFVGHVAHPYSQRSAGYRAGWKCLDLLRQLGHQVYACPLPWNPPYNDPLPFPPIPLVHPSMMRGAIHIVPESLEVGKDVPKYDYLVQWSLMPLVDIRLEPNSLHYSWDDLMDAPRLCIDVIEDFFVPPKDWDPPKSGTMHFNGKNFNRFPGSVGTVITPTWPDNRQELARILQRHDLVISGDSYSMLNLEATLCRTPVLVDVTPPPTDDSFSIRYGYRFPANTALRGSFFTLKGITDSVAGLDEARRTVKDAYPYYREVVCNMIKDDVPNMAEDCRRHFNL